MSKYFRNFILCGDIDHHCLLCQETLHTVENLEKHIRWEKHRKSVKGLSPIPKYKKDSIFKLNDNYYCEHCNRILPTMAAVSNHIGEERHQNIKANPIVDLPVALCKRESGYILLGEKNTKITNKEWYGVIDSKCIFCDVTVDNFVKHVALSHHMIPMIQSNIMHEDGQYYRMINEKHGYCFLCKKTFQTELSDHLQDELHIEKTKAQNGSDAKADHDKKLDVAIKLINSQKDYFDIDLENKVATCKVCTAYVNINFKFMVEHKKLHNITDNDKVEQAPVDMDEVIKSLKLKKSDDEGMLHYYDHGKQRAEVAKFGRNNFIKLIFPGDKGYCSLCATYISAHMKNFTEHVRGQIHMGHLELKGLDKSGKSHVKPSYKTKKFKAFVKMVTHSKELQVIWINKQFTLDIFSFMLISIIKDAHSNKFHCYACDIIYDDNKDKKHCDTEAHKEALNNSDVITTVKDELIREVRPNVYHCAVCNLIFPYWETLEKHLNSWKHVFTKNDRNALINDKIEQLVCSTLQQERMFSTLLSLGLLPK